MNTTSVPFLPAAVWASETSLPSITFFSLVSAIGALAPRASGLLCAGAAPLAGQAQGERRRQIVDG